MAKGEDDLARAAIERSITAKQVAASFAEQVNDQTEQVENLKSALRRLEMKLTEAQSSADVLIAKHRRARALGKASDARMRMGDGSSAAAFDRMGAKIHHAEAVSEAKAELAVDGIEERLAALEKGDAVEKVLAEIKSDPRLKTIPIVVLTTSRSEQDVLRSYELQANCYITKPVDLEQFIAVVKSIENFWFTIVTLPHSTCQPLVSLYSDRLPEPNTTSTMLTP